MSEYNRGHHLEIKNPLTGEIKRMWTERSQIVLWSLTEMRLLPVPTFT